MKTANQIDLATAARDYPHEWGKIQDRIEELSRLLVATFTPDHAYLHSEAGDQSLRVVCLCPGLNDAGALIFDSRNYERVH